MQFWVTPRKRSPQMTHPKRPARKPALRESVEEVAEASPGPSDCASTMEFRSAIDFLWFCQLLLLAGRFQSRTALLKSRLNVNDTKLPIFDFSLRGHRPEKSN